jgi:hypothetical protein
MVEDVPSALAASRRERAWGVPAMTQCSGIGSAESSTSAGKAKVICDTVRPLRYGVI